MALSDPYGVFNFLIEIEGLVIGGFSECSGLQVETELFEYREGGLNEYMHNFVGATKYTQPTPPSNSQDLLTAREIPLQVDASTSPQATNKSPLVLRKDTTENLEEEIQRVVTIVLLL